MAGISLQLAFVRNALVALFALPLAGCGAATPTTKSPGAADSTSAVRAGRLGRLELLQCLGAPKDAIFEPERLFTRPVPGLAVQTFVQQTASCGQVDRRYVSYVPAALGAKSDAPVLIVLHGQGASAEAMREFQARRTFDALADKEGLIVVYGNGLPTAFNLAGIPNSGRWRSEYTELAGSVDEIEYLQQIVRDLTARDVVSGGNDVYLVGQSNGGGMALSAARQEPNAYAGVAVFMPFVGFSPTAPDSLAGTRLRHVLFAYSAADPMLPPRYAADVLAPLAQGWARALGVDDSELESPVAMQLPDRIVEGKAGVAGAAAIETTRNSTVQQLDLRSENGALRQLVFDRAGHFWPTLQYTDPASILRLAGLRNQDIEGATELWRFFRE